MTDTREYGLLPCPFCGGEAEIETPLSDSEDGYWLGCKNYHCIGFRLLSSGIHNKELAVSSWNTRTPSNAVAKLVEAAKEYIATNPAFRLRPVGGEGSPARMQQIDAIAAEDAFRDALAPFTGVSSK